MVTGKKSAFQGHVFKGTKPTSIWKNKCLLAIFCPRLHNTNINFRPFYTNVQCKCGRTVDWHVSVLPPKRKQTKKPKLCMYAAFLGKGENLFQIAWKGKLPFKVGLQFWNLLTRGRHFQRQLFVSWENFWMLNLRKVVVLLFMYLFFYFRCMFGGVIQHIRLWLPELQPILKIEPW